MYTIAALASFDLWQGVNRHGSRADCDYLLNSDVISRSDRHN